MEDEYGLSASKSDYEEPEIIETLIKTEKKRGIPPTKLLPIEPIDKLIKKEKKKGIPPTKRKPRN